MMQVETKHNRIIAGAGEYLAVCMKKKHFKKNEIRKFFSIIHLKPCTECENLKNFDEFYKQKNSPDGLSQKCIKCVKKLVQEYKEKNKETVLQTKRNSFYKNKKIILEKQKQYYENNKEKIRNRITIWE